MGVRLPVRLVCEAHVRGVRWAQQQARASSYRGPAAVAWELEDHAAAPSIMAAIDQGGKGTGKARASFVKARVGESCGMKVQKTPRSAVIMAA